MRKTIWVNGQLVKHRMHQLGLSERDAAEAARMTSTSIRSIVSKNELSKSFGVAQVSRLAATLGITVSDYSSLPRSRVATQKMMFEP